MSTARIIRYVVEYWSDQPDVGYHASLGLREARDWAIQNARNYGGRVVCWYSDGTCQEVLPYGGRPFQREDQIAA